MLTPTCGTRQAKHRCQRFGVFLAPISRLRGTDLQSPLKRKSLATTTLREKKGGPNHLPQTDGNGKSKRAVLAARNQEPKRNGVNNILVAKSRLSPGPDEHRKPERRGKRLKDQRRDRNRRRRQCFPKREVAAPRSSRHRNGKYPRKFDSTLGYPGEGPPEGASPNDARRSQKTRGRQKEEEFCQCEKGGVCTRKTHYHRRQAKKGAAKRMAEKKAQKNTRTIRNCRRCTEAIEKCDHADDHYHHAPKERGKGKAFADIKLEMEQKQKICPEPAKAMEANVGDALPDVPPAQLNLIRQRALSVPLDCSQPVPSAPLELNRAIGTPRHHAAGEEALASASGQQESKNDAKSSPAAAAVEPEEQAEPAEREERKSEEREEECRYNELEATEERRLFVNFSDCNAVEIRSFSTKVENIPYLIRKLLSFKSSQRQWVETNKLSPDAMREVLGCDLTTRQGVTQYPGMSRITGMKVIKRSQGVITAKPFQSRYPHTYIGEVYTEVARRVLRDKQVAKYNAAAGDGSINPNIQSAVVRAMEAISDTMKWRPDPWADTFIYIVNQLYLKGLRMRAAMNTTSTTPLNSHTGPSAMCARGGPCSGCAQ